MAHLIEDSTGCFDDIFAVFKNYSHPIIVLENCAFKWMGVTDIMTCRVSSAISYPVVDDKC